MIVELIIVSVFVLTVGWVVWDGYKGQRRGWHKSGENTNTLRSGEIYGGTSPRYPKGSRIDAYGAVFTDDAHDTHDTQD